MASGSSATICGYVEKLSLVGSIFFMYVMEMITDYVNPSPWHKDCTRGHSEYKWTKSPIHDLYIGLVSNLQIMYNIYKSNCGHEIVSNYANQDYNGYRMTGGCFT